MRPCSKSNSMDGMATCTTGRLGATVLESIFHYSPRITLGVIGAGILSLTLLLTRHVEMDAEVVYVLLLVLAEAGQLVLRWILELQYVPTFRQRSIYSGGLRPTVQHTVERVGG
jgi:hypothetical protein